MEGNRGGVMDLRNVLAKTFHNNCIDFTNEQSCLDYADAILNLQEMKDMKLKAEGYDTEKYLSSLQSSANEILMDRPDSKSFLKLREAKALTIDEGFYIIKYIKYLEKRNDFEKYKKGLQRFGEKFLNDSKKKI